MAKNYHHLVYEERCQIYALRKSGESIPYIAKQLGVHSSTISRELSRNTGMKGYRYKQAQENADKRRHKASSVPKKMNEEVVKVVNEGLSKQWSPDQISGRMKLEGNCIRVSYETIYRYVWKDKHNGGTLYKNLRHKGKKYNKRGSKKSGRGCIPNRVDIKERPAIVEKKQRVGDIELDTIRGSQHKGSIVSMVDRSSKLTKLAKVSRANSKEVKAAIIKRLSPIKKFINTFTADNGKEFADHAEISSALEASFYFATPYHSWERGLNEHTNGLVRQYFPKDCNFENISHDEVMVVEELLNNRPRKCLGYQTPAFVFKQKTMCYNSGVG